MHSHPAVSTVALSVFLVLCGISQAADVDSTPEVATAPAPLTVVDANGVRVGRYGPALNQGAIPSAAAYLKVGGQSTTIPLTLTLDAVSTRLDYYASSLWFSNADCTGTAYIVYAFSTGALPSAIRITDTQTLLYVADSADVTQGVQAHSVWTVSNTSGECTTQTPSGNVYQVSSPPTDITGKYTRPFSVK
jgi:hypothetical protein